MSTNQTKNLHLHSWEPLDRFTREEFNDNWNGIDAAWGDLEGRLLADVEALANETAERKAADATETSERKAADSNEAAERKTADTTLQKNIDAEATARQSADKQLQTNIDAKAATAALNTEIADRKAADAALQAQINTKLSIYVGTYTGTSPNSVSGSQTIELGFQPKAVFIRAVTARLNADDCRKKDWIFAVPGFSTSYNNFPDITFNGTSFTVYNTTGDTALNNNGKVYIYFVLY